jgi:hypothetical protein
MQKLLEESPKFLRHHYVKRRQSAFYHGVKALATSVKVLLQVDFAENYTCEQQDEVQAAHWNQSQVSLFTACFWTSPSSPKGYVVVSNNLHHDKSTVSTSLIQLLHAFFAEYPGCNVLHAFSDGPSSQFKNRFMFSILQKLRVHFALHELSWSFFAASHGKGPVDGLGAQVKRQVTHAVINRRVTSVNNAEDFYATLLSADSHPHAILSTPEREQQAMDEVGADEIFQTAPKQANISLDHYWVFNAGGAQRSHLSPSTITAELIDLDSQAAGTTTSTLNETSSSSAEQSSVFSSNVQVGDIVKVMVPSERGPAVAFLAVVQEVRATHSVKVAYLKASRMSSVDFTLAEYHEIDYFHFSELINLDVVPVLSKRGIYTFPKNPL